MDDDIFNPEQDGGESDNSSDSETKGGISADLIRGHINTIILRTLYERDKYGYEIIEEIEAKSHGQYTLKQPTLYSALKRLESQGYINAYWKTDEISQGGRRKYYTLTDSGRAITERNQAEWEYSRTVIDNLISDRNFDFTQPPPTNVDFKILKNSTSRVPVVKDEEREVTYDAPDGEQVVEIKREEVAPVAETKPAEDNAPAVTPEAVAENTGENDEDMQVKPDEALNGDAPIEVTEFTYTTSTETVTQQEPAIINPVAAYPQEQPPAEPAPAPTDEPVKETQQAISDEEAKSIHENYLKLISEAAPPPEEPLQTPYADEVDTNSLLYNNNPPAERDYRAILNGLFPSAAKQPRPEPAAPKAQPEAADDAMPQYRQIVVDSVRVDDATMMARNDGLNVETSDYTIDTRKKRYSRGAALLKSSLIVGVLMLLEFVLCLIFKDDLGVGGIKIAYPLVILALACAQVLFFTVIYFTDIGKSNKRPSSLIYLSACIITCIIAVLMIFVIAIILNVNFTIVGDIMAKIIIPCIVALNIPIFGTIFYLFSK